MQLRHLQTFVAVSQTLSFSRAGERLHRSQSSISEQMQALESSLGTALFDRSGRQLALTAAGSRLLGYAIELLRIADEASGAVLAAPGELAGTLRVGALESLGTAHLPPLLACFQARHRQVSVSLSTADSRGLREGVAAGALDAAVVYGQVAGASGLACETLAADPIVVLMPSTHRLASHTRIVAADLREEPFLLTPPGCIYRAMFDHAFSDPALPRPKPIGEYASLGVIRGLVQAGMGCAFMPLAAVLPDGATIAVPWSGQGAPISVIRRRGAAHSAASDAFLALARSLLGAQTSRWPPST